MERITPTTYRVWNGCIARVILGYGEGKNSGRMPFHLW
jgi:hypothetical protein